MPFSGRSLNIAPTKGDWAATHTSFTLSRKIFIVDELIHMCYQN